METKQEKIDKILAHSYSTVYSARRAQTQLLDLIAKSIRSSALWDGDYVRWHHPDTGKQNFCTIGQGMSGWQIELDA